MSDLGYPVVPTLMSDEKEHRRRLAVAINLLLQGKTNVTTTVTLTASSTTTTLSDKRIGPTSYIDFMPLTANARTAMANLYVSSQMNASATLTHASSANADQNFRVLILG